MDLSPLRVRSPDIGFPAPPGLPARAAGQVLVGVRQRQRSSVRSSRRRAAEFSLPGHDRRPGRRPGLLAPAREVVPQAPLARGVGVAEGGAGAGAFRRCVAANTFFSLRRSRCRC